MGNDVTTDLKANSGPMKRELKEAEGAVQGFGNSVKRIAVAIGAAFAAKKIFDFGKGMFALYQTQEEAERKLEYTLRQTGNAAGFTADEMKRMASDMQAVTKFGDEVVLGAEDVIATFKEIKGDTFKETLKLSGDLAEKWGLDLPNAARMLSKALVDPGEGLMRLKSMGAAFSDQEIELVQALKDTGHVAEAQGYILDKLKGAYGGLAEEMAKTAGGRMTQFKNRIGDIGERIGMALLPAVEAVLPAVEWLIKRFEEAVPITIEWAKAVAEFAAQMWEYVGPAVEWVANIVGEALLVAFTAAQTAVENFGDVATYALEAFELAAVKVWENLKYYLGEVLPEYLMWFGRNWKEIFTDLYNATTAIFQNMWENVKNFFSNTWKWLSGQEQDWKWTGLLEGFESTLEELPRIADRKKGDLERSLEKDLDTIGRRLEKRYQRNLEINRAAVSGFWGSFVPSAAEAAAAGAAPAAKGGYGTDKVWKDGKLVDKKDAAKDDKTYRAAIEDLVAMNKRITQAAAGGGAESIDKKQLAEQEKQRKAAEELAAKQELANTYLKGMATNLQTVADELPKAGALK